MSDLESIIADSVNDATFDDTPEVDAVETPEVEAAPVAESLADAEPATPEIVEEPATPEVQAATPATPAEPQDDFAKLVGVPQVGIAGRENRIPYSRVKKITEKAVSDIAEAALGRKLNAGEKASDVVKAHVAQIPTLTAKVQDYETRLNTVGQFEDVMVNDPNKFLTMLSKLPAYKDFFSFVQQAAAGIGQNQPAQGTPAAGQPAVAQNPADVMPEPDEELADGSRVYSMDGLKKLLAWNASQVESRVSKQFEERYKPIENEWQERKRLEAVVPVIRKQIEEAKTWPLFNDNQDEIVAALKANPNLSLEGAYRQIVVPKIVADRNKIKQDVLREVQSAPTSTAVPARAATKPVAPVGAGPRSLEDVIKESIASLK